MARSRRGFTLVELLTVVAIIAALVALLLPAVQAAREASRRSKCQNNLRQLALALDHFEGMRRKFPIGCEGCGPTVPFAEKLYTSWIARVLPLVEQRSLAVSYRFDSPSTKPPNSELGRTVLDVVLCPSTTSDEKFSQTGLWKGQAFTDYGGLYGVEGGEHTADEEERDFTKQTLKSQWLDVLVYETPTAAKDICDGLSQTAAVGEARIRRDSTQEPMAWTCGQSFFAQEMSNPINGDNGLENELGSPHPGGASLAFCDGHVAFVADDTPQEVLNALLTRAGGD